MPRRDHISTLVLTRKQFCGSVLRGLVIVLSCTSATLANDRGEVDFASDVYPILRRACFECHGAEKQEGGLRLDNRAAAFETAFESGLIVPKQPEDSELLRRILLPKSDDEVMPALGEPLPKAQVEAIRRWIEAGAVWPESFEQSKHWSYTAPVRPVIPRETTGDWQRNAIDFFVLRRLQQEGLQPAAEADPATLVRRLSLDLIGLPPTPEQVDAFLADLSHNAYERLVDRLLNSPQFGERWARPWLDLARYADSHGFQRDNFRDIWAYRDWVIAALNADMPFDQFTVEQIAGDLLPDATESQKIATGFHRCAPTNVEAGSLPEETRIEQVIDRVNTTGAVWLGTTLECCQCHDHKYDPFSQQDYYRLLAYYNNTEAEADRANPKVPSSIAFIGPKMSLSDSTLDRRRDELQEDIAKIQRKLADRRGQIEAELPSRVSELAQQAANAPQTHELAVTNFTSAGETDTYEILDDGSVLLVGDDPPERDTYYLTLQTNVPDIRGLKLEALAHDSLPGKGPGRGDSQRTNFVLNTFTAAVRSSGSNESPMPVQFVNAKASFSQQNWDVSGAVDDNPKSGWAIAPQFGQSHWAIFETASPIVSEGETEIAVSLVHNFGGARSIGRVRVSAITGELGQGEIPADIIQLVNQSSDQWKPKQREKVLGYCVSTDRTAQQLTRQMTRLKKQMAEIAPDTTLVMNELAEPRMAAVFERGDYRSPGEPVTPGTPAILHTLREGPPNRLSLAHWLVDEQNPLVARVTVNRWWAELFGRGIVTTVEDFGLKGEPPTHPELLDWLAVEFVESGWSMKHVLKTIVMSATYRQSSNITPELFAQDDQNSLYARGPRFRMDAEMIRDNALSIAGLLSLKQGGPSIRPYQPDGVWSKVGGDRYDYKVSPGEEQYRRGVYVVLKRGAPYPSFVNFDATARLACVVQRSRTNTPLQALTLLNDPVYVEAATGLANRVLTHGPDNIEDRLTYAFRLCTARAPGPAELNTLRTLYEQQLKANRQTDSATKRKGLPSGVDPAEFAAWQAVATTLLNLHETITKG